MRRLKGRWIVLLFFVLIGAVVALGITDKNSAKKKGENTKDTEATEKAGETNDEEKPEGELSGMCFVVDAGHGGYDPGMVNADGVIEKELNLQMAYRLKEALEQHGAQVTLTRDSDNGLYDEGTNGRKMQDLKNRCRIIDETAPVLTISIHQNSFPDETIYGPQVFYYHTSEGSMELAKVIQACLNEDLKVEKPREAKDNGSYYILKKSSSVIALVECGFLSNERESQLLVTEDYQKQLANSICRGVIAYVLQNSISQSTT